MERALEVRTGESISIRYELAGLGSRFLAMFVDLAIQVLTLTIVIVAMLLAIRPLANATSAIALSPKLGQSFAIAFTSLAVFMLFFGYFIVFESVWNGRTPGKRLLGLRVVRDGGFPVDFVAATIRNLVRTLEFGLGFYAVSAISMLISKENKRLGDLAAGTIVVRDRAVESFALLGARVDDAHGRIGALSPADWVRVSAYIARRANLEPIARTRIAANLAAELRPKLHASFEHLTDDDLLSHIALSATS